VRRSGIRRLPLSPPAAWRLIGRQLTAVAIILVAIAIHPPLAVLPDVGILLAMLERLGQGGVAVASAFTVGAVPTIEDRALYSPAAILETVALAGVGREPPVQERAVAHRRQGASALGAVVVGVKHHSVVLQVSIAMAVVAVEGAVFHLNNERRTRGHGRSLF
jgi:hypothetical protein